MKTLLGTSRPHPVRYVRATLAVAALVCSLGAVAGAATASASTEAYCAPCFSGSYGIGIADGNAHFITRSYAHETNVANAWICAGDNQTKEYVCNPNETWRNYGGGSFLNGSWINHYHGYVEVNAHVDF